MAKKVNTGFLIGLTAVLGGLAVGGFAIFYFSRHTSRYFLNHSLDEEAKGNLPLAAGYMTPAITKDPSNKALYIRQGDLFARLVTQDPRYLGNSESAYRRALEVDPAFPDAIDRLLKDEIGRFRAGANSPTFFKELKDLADKGVASDSANPHYATWSAISVVHPWIFSNAPASATIERPANALAEIAKAHPEEFEAAFYASLVKLRRAQTYRESRQDEKARPLLAEAAAFNQSAVKARPNDPDVQLRAYQIFRDLSVIDTDHKADYQAQAKSAIAAAVANAKPEDDLYDDICHWQIDQLNQDKAPREEIEKAYLAWSTARPHDARVRLEHAEFLGSDPAHRSEAIALLAAPISPDPSVTGFAAIQAKGNERGILVALNKLRADDAFAAKPADRAKLVASIDDDLTKIQQMGLGEDASLLTLRGKSQMLHNQPIEAVKSFDRAQAMIGAGTFEPDLWMQRQRAYLITGQTGSAQRMMEELLPRMPGNSDLRTRLARLYVETGQTDKAAEQLKILDANPPKDPALVASIAELKVQAAKNDSNPEAAKTQVHALPEQTREQQLRKAQMAAGVNETDEAIRLYRLVLSANAADAQAGTGLIGLYLQNNKKPEALQVAEDACKAKPDDARWKNVREQLAANTPEAESKIQEELINQIADPMMRALQLASFAMAHNDMDGAARHYAEADKINPKDPRVLIARIDYMMRLKKFDDAARAVDAAADANADRMNGLSIRTRFALARLNRDEALKYGNQLVSQYGEFAVNWLLYGQAQQAAGQLRDAVGSMDTALQHQPNLTPAFQIKAICLEALGQYTDEKAAITQARRIAPNDQALRDLDLNWELHHGDADKVVTTCQDLLTKEPNNPAVYAAFAQASRVAADSKYRGDPAAYKQMLEKARSVLDEAFKRFGKTADVARLYGPQAIILDGLGDLAGAESALKQYAAIPEMANAPGPSEELAKFYETHNRIPEAEAAWKDAYAKSRQAVEAELALAQFYARHGKADDALKVLQANSTDQRIQRQRIEQLLAMGHDHLPEAKTALAAAFGNSPTDPAALYYRGIIELGSGDTTAGINDLTSSRDKDPDSVMTRIWLARGLLANHKRDDAVVQLEYALQRAPLRDEVRVLLLQAYQQNPPRWADFDRVVLEAEQSPALNINPEWYQLASRGLSARGQFEQAKQQILAAQKLAPNSPALDDDYANVLVQAKDWQGVLAQTDRQIAAGRKDAVIFQKHAIARAGLGDKPGSLHDFDTAIATYQAAQNFNGVADVIATMNQSVGPDEALLRVSLLPDTAARDMLTAGFYGDKGDFARQVQIAEGILAKRPDLSKEMKGDVYNTIATAYLATAQWEKAHQAFDNLLLYRPDDLIVLNNAAYLLADKLNSPLDAKSYSKRAYDLAMAHGGAPGIIDTHGWILTLCGNRDAREGLAILQKLVDSNETLTKPRYHLAMALLKANRAPEAADQLKIVQAQMAEDQKNHRPIDSELLDGVPKALQQVQQKSGQP